MKYALLIFLMAYIINDAPAQTSSTSTNTSTTKSNATTTASKKKKPVKKAPAGPSKPVTITLKNMAEKQMPIYAGSKEGLKNIKVKMVGGLSTNTLYVKTNDVVCILSSDGKKTMDCKDVKPSTTVMEINSSGREISSK
jgi:hypothetical protein